MKGENILTPTDLKAGEKIQAEFYGERLVWLLVK